MTKPDLSLGQKVRMTHESFFVYEPDNTKVHKTGPKELEVVVIGYGYKCEGRYIPPTYGLFGCDDDGQRFRATKRIPVYRVKESLTGMEYFAIREHLVTD